VFDAPQVGSLPFHSLGGIVRKAVFKARDQLPQRRVQPTLELGLSTGGRRDGNQQHH